MTKNPINQILQMTSYVADNLQAEKIQKMDTSTPPADYELSSSNESPMKPDLRLFGGAVQDGENPHGVVRVNQETQFELPLDDIDRKQLDIKILCLF